MPDDNYLDIRDLDAGYGRSQVLFGVTMSVPWRGGRNGAGKTTLMKAIVGELPLLRGSASLDTRDVGALPTEQRIRLGMGYIPQEHWVFGRLSVRDNLAVGALTNRDSGAVNRVLEIFSKLGQRLDQVAGTLSGGERPDGSRRAPGSARALPDARLTMRERGWFEERRGPHPGEATK